MGTHERRSGMALDEAYEYCRLLESKQVPPSLDKVLSAINTVDRALAEGWGKGTSRDAWSQVRDILFNHLVTSAPGYFLVYSHDQSLPLEPGQRWPASGFLEFHPARSKRRTDIFVSDLQRLHPLTRTCLRWCFAEGKHSIGPADFDRDYPSSQEEEGISSRLDQLVEEARRGKKVAHRKWWQLYWEAGSCKDRQRKHQMQREMAKLQSVWGKPAYPH